MSQSALRDPDYLSIVTPGEDGAWETKIVRAGCFLKLSVSYLTLVTSDVADIALTSVIAVYLGRAERSRD